MAPGPDLVLITGLVLNGSLRVATGAALGMIMAGAVQAGLGAAGLAALLAARPDLFAAFRWTGAVVLLGWASLALRRAVSGDGAEARAPSRPPAEVAAHAPHAPPCEPSSPAAAPTESTGPSVRQAFGQGLLCTGSNPKVGIFLMAFLPQFVPPGMSPAAGVPLLAACYLSLGLIWLLTWMRLVHRLARHLRSPRMLRIADGLTAAVFGVFAVRLVLSG
ncbi:LysE family translocator [Streptomyces sp. NBC_01260]|uniref:LysE family translocator n=1 Tax=unclassified Streptomyces TaxID=2593676 RepID=UPI000F468318|nr:MULTISPECIES: LysE family translocator [unclassified Streptomyces]ROQ78233.1 threonine/homoserine/homoserine lactone efflux protein [Streptomyces sp. CEV 2-1]RPK37905.1 leucine export protein LeuE [Streptomyces sp. ADI92-24]